MSYDPRNLFEHAEFARRLAIGLTGSTDQAEELVQETWVDVLAAPPRDDRSPRGFLATVLRRTAARSLRSASSRTRRERAAARPEALPSAAEVAARLEMHRHLVQAVEALPEAYRQAVLLRFFDGLAPSEIAARSGVPVETVRTRVKRALGQLRENLDRKYGSRGAWLVLAAPGAEIGASSASAQALLWAVCMSRMTLGVSLALLSLVTLLVIWPPAEDGGAGVHPASSGAAGDGVSGGAATRGEPSRAAPRRELASGVAITGTIVVTASQGGEPESADGTFEIHSGAEAERVEVRAGKFRYEPSRAPARGARLRIGKVVLAGRPARLERSEFAWTGFLALRAIWLPRTELHVVDATTRRQLSDVQVLKDVIQFRGRVHPGSYKPENVLLADAQSPLFMPPGQGTVEYWVRAKGYAWQPIQIDHTEAGTRTVALQRAAAITIRMDRFEPGWNLFVRLYAADAPSRGPCLAEVAPEAGQPGPTSVVMRGLPAGPVRVEAHFGHWFDPPRQVAKSSATLFAGEMASLALQLDASQLPSAPVPLSGTLRVAGAPDDFAFSLQLRRAFGPPLRRADWQALASKHLAREVGSSEFRWDFGRVTPGRYVIVVDPLQFVHELEIGDQPRRDVRIDLPELADVLVKVTDTGTGKPVDVKSIAWGRPAPEGIRTWSYQNVPFDAVRGGFAFMAPVGEYDVLMRSDRHADVGLHIEVKSGRNSFAAQTRQLPHRFVEWRHGDTLIPITWATIPSVETGDPKPGLGTGRVRAVENGRAKIVVTEPGNYRLVFGPIAGFEPVPPRAVTIDASRTDPIVIPLTRRQ